MSEINLSNIKRRVVEDIVKGQKEGLSIGLFGMVGAGKTSTINALFSVNMDTAISIPCTKDIHEVQLNIRNLHRPTEEYPEYIPLSIYDFPGLGDGEEGSTEQFMEWYETSAPQLDLVLWIIRSDVKMYEFDVIQIRRLIKKLPELKSRIVIGLNHADKVEDTLWNTRINQPSEFQEEQYKIVLKQVKKLVHDRCELSSEIIEIYSAKKAWRLDSLFTTIQNSCPKTKRWILDDIRSDYRSAFLAQVQAEYREVVASIIS